MIPWFLDTHIDHTISEGCGKLQKEARRKEEELRLDTLVPETRTHLHHHIKKRAKSDHKQKNERQKALASLNKNLPFKILDLQGGIQVVTKLKSIKCLPQ